MRAVASPSISWIDTGIAFDVSPNGNFAVGSDSSNNAFLWSATSGLQNLGFRGAAFSVSSDGSAIAGWTSGQGTQGIRWTAASGAAVINLARFPVFEARKISADGNTVAGIEPISFGNNGFRWTTTGGLSLLGGPPSGGTYGFANAMSEDGNYIATATNGSTAAYRIGGSGGQVIIPALGTGQGLLIDPYDISDDASVVVGQASNGTTVPFRWTLTAGTQQIPSLDPTVPTGIAWSVTADGNTVVGEFGTAYTTSPSNRAFIWDPINGTRDLNTVLTGLGIDLGGQTLYDAFGISSDGTVIVGDGSNGAFVAVVPEPAFCIFPLVLMMILARRQKAPNRTVT